MSRTVGIVLAAGKGERARTTGGATNIPKQFREFRGRPLVCHALELFEESSLIDDIVIVGPSPATSWPMLPFSKIAARVTGGDSRPESVRRGLAAIPGDTDIIVVHDAVRPNATPALLARVVEAARTGGAAVPAIVSRDSLKTVLDGRVVETVRRDAIQLAQTPQAFRRSVIENAYAAAARRNDECADLDDAAVVEKSGAVVSVVEGEPWNLKITFDEDFEWLA
ncbi:MAG: 2-C-methyl-D-erythritol 4-phosphate cytidylyltransferase [Deltaproteobacteria bacterium]|nr:2-C-methyl-D-erythritol 4-phosphate cytidylyltransferase [Deltaproteobacteria bacterium]